MITGVGLGFRRDLAKFLLESESYLPRFIELAPENWMGIGGYWKKVIRQAAEKYPVLSHGLSLSIGSPDPLDWGLLKKIKFFLEEFSIELYSEHLSYSKCDNAHLYDLLPIPFREDALKHVVQRISQVQDFLGRQIAIENVSYYTSLEPEMSELEFINAVIKESGCKLLLDLNNVYVNAFNHKYDPKEFVAGLPLIEVAYIHMAGHEQRSPDLVIDTHGQPIIDPVYDLFTWTVAKIKPVPVLLERDFNFPEFEELQTELLRLDQIIGNFWKEKEGGLLHAA